MSFSFAARGRAPRRRGADLTPMIDVVFLLLVFFMLSSRFGLETVLEIPFAAPGGGAETGWEGPPRIVDVWPGELRLNGVPVAEAALAGALAPLLPRADAPVLLRARGGALVADLLAAGDLLRAARAGTPVLVGEEPR